MGPLAQHLLGLIKRHGLEHREPQLVAMIMRKLLRGRLTEGMARLYLRRIQDLVEHLINFPNYLHRAPTAEQIHPDGVPEIEIGSLVEAPDIRFGVNPSKGVQHAYVSGRTGSGKTVLLRGLIVGIDEWARRTGRRIVFLVLDLKGGDFADLPGRLGSHWRHYNIHESFHLGWDGPEKMPSNQWIQFLSKAFAARYGLQYGATTLSRLITWILPILNPQPNGRLLYPSPQLLLDIIAHAPETLFSSKSPYTQSLAQALEKLCQESGEVFRVSRGYDILEAVNGGNSCVIQMHNLSQEVKNFAVDLLLGRLWLHRLNQQYKTDNVDIVVAIDECDALVSHEVSELAWPDQSPPLTMLAKQGRELGIMLILGASQLSGTSRLILSNIHNLFLLQQASAESIADAARTLLLPPGGEQILSALPTGNAVFRFSESGWPHATLGKIDYIPARREPVTAPYDNTDFVPAKTLSDSPEVNAALESRVCEHNLAKGRRRRQKGKELSQHARKLLDLRSTHIGWPMARLWPKFDTVPSPATKIAVRKELIKLGLAEFVQARLGQHNCLMMEITDPGWELLGMKPIKLAGQGSIDTKHYLHWVAETERRKGCEVKIEAIAPGTNHRVDVSSIRAGEFHAYEICSHCIDNIAEHLITCLLRSDAVATVTIVSPRKSIQKETQVILKGEPSLAPVAARIKHELVETYLKELFE